MGPRAHGRIVFWEGASLWILSAPAGEQYPRTDFHAHHAIQVTLALTGGVHFDGGGERVGGGAIAIAPDARHAFEGTGRVAHMFVASDGLVGRRLCRRLFSGGPIATIPPGLLGDVPARLRSTFEDPRHTDDDLRALGRALVAQLVGGDLDAVATDPRISRLLRSLAARLDGPLSLRDVAQLVGLSPGRTRHLFVQHTGLPFRTYVLWLRLLRATEMFAGGASLTDAAHRAGFSDSAHLSRTFRRMFGVAAATLRVS